MQYFIIIIVVIFSTIQNALLAIQIYKMGTEGRIRIAMQVPYFSADARIGIYANFDRIGISAGYILTTFDINSHYRDFSYRGVYFDKFYPQRPVSHGAFLTLSYYLR